MKRRRILHLLDTTGPGGAETVFLTLLGGLGTEWESIPVVAGPGWVEDSLRQAGLSPLLIPSTRRFDLPYLRLLARAIRDRRVDLVQAHLLTTTLYGGLAARIRGVPAIGTIHGDPDFQGAGALERVRYRLIRACTYRVVCVSASLKARTVERAGFRPQELEVIPNGIDTAVFRPGIARALRQELAVGEDTFLVGSVGNVRPAKDYATLLRTAREVRARVGGAVRFVVAGERTAPLHDELLELRARLGVEDTVSFVGFREDIPELLRAMDLLLLTSAHEGFSLVAVQAMATGLPVVATRCGGPEEILTDGVDGILCPVADADALASALLALRADPSRRERMGREGRRSAEERFSLRAMVGRYEALYREALGG